MNPRQVFCIAFVSATLVRTALPAGAQDLNAKLEQMGTLRTTAHYRLYGTISKKRSYEYERILEYAYRDFSRGFSDMMQGISAGQGKLTHGPTSRATREKRGGASGTSAELYRVIVLQNKDEYM